MSIAASTLPTAEASASPLPRLPSGQHLSVWLVVSVLLHAAAFAAWHRWQASHPGTVLVSAPTLDIRITQESVPAKSNPTPAPREVSPPVGPAPVEVAEKAVTPLPATPPPVKKADPKPAPKPVQARKPAPARQTKVAASPPVSRPAPETAAITHSKQAASQATSTSHRAEARKPARADLARLLRDAIEDHKRYPFTARRRGQQGTATVGFTLTPTGGIEALALDGSSGHKSLDKAALAAVEGIAPFQMAGNYLDSPAEFRLDIAFRLSRR